METLASTIERDGGLQEADAVGWAIRLARTVEEIHERGKVHGRLSAAGVRAESTEASADGELVAFADLPENVAYHSPERERGEGGSQADDTWAVGVFLYYALSGSLPFNGANDDEIRRKIRTVPAPPLAVFDVGDDELQAIVDRALARNREGRTQTVTALRKELEGWHPDLQHGELLPLFAEDDEEVTMIHSASSEEMRRLLGAAALGNKPGSKQGAKSQAAKSEPAKTEAKAAAQAEAKAEPAKSEAPKSAPPSQPAMTSRPDGAPMPRVYDEPSGDGTDSLTLIAPSLRPEILAGEKLTAAATPDASKEEAPRSDASTEQAPEPDARPSVSSSSLRRASTPAPSAASIAESPAPASVSSIDPPEPRSRATIVIVCVVLAFALGVAMFLLTQQGSGTDAAPSPGDAHSRLPPPSHDARDKAPAAEAAAVEVPAAPMTAAVPSAMSSARAPSTSPSDTRSTTAPAPRGDLAACVAPAFASESFDAATDFSFVCGETDPLKIGNQIRTELVRARHGVEGGMKDWALLGWHELAAVALIRGRCCPGAKPLALAEAPSCAPVATVLDSLTSAARAATDPKDATLAAAGSAYTTEVYCLVRSNVGHRFGHPQPPDGGEDTTFQRFLDRFVRARRTAATGGAATPWAP